VTACQKEFSTAPIADKNPDPSLPVVHPIDTTLGALFCRWAIDEGRASSGSGRGRSGKLPPRTACLIVHVPVMAVHHELREASGGPGNEGISGERRQAPASVIDRLVWAAVR